MILKIHFSDVTKICYEMLRVSGLTLTDKSEHSEQVKKVFKHLVDIGRKIEEKHQVHFL